MNPFFRENILGVLAVSTAGSLIATVVGRFMPPSSSDSHGVFEALSRQVPIWILFPYSVLLIMAFALWALRSRYSQQSALRSEIAAIKGERDTLRQQVDGLKQESDNLKQQLFAKRASTVSQPDLMRFVALVLSTAQGSQSNPITHEYVCKHVAGLAGQGVPHASIGEALGAMLHIGAVASSYSGLVLVIDWKDKMRAAGVPDAIDG